MTDKLKPYPEYKDSGLRWLGKVPKHWAMTRMKHLFRERNGRGYPDEPLLAATQTKGVVRKEDYENRTVVAMKDLHNLKLVRIGDFVISLRSFQGGIEYARHQGIISPAYTILYSVNQGAHGFYASFFKSQPFISALTLFVTGIRQGQNIDYMKLSRSPLPVPTAEEQQVISAFIRDFDRKCAHFIRNRRRLIQVLNEQKQAIINRAVTRGLDPNVRLKPSGIEWLGEIPEHWEQRRLKFLVSNVNEQTSERQPDEIYIALEHVESWTGRITFPNGDVTFGSQVKRFRPGDVLFGKLRPYLAKVTRPQMPGVCVGEFLVFRGAEQALLPDFLEQELRSKQFIDIINSSTFGAKMPRADWTFIGNLIIVYPPTHSEQLAIHNEISKQTDSLQRFIDKTQREVDLIREYRTRLISDVVTGKLDVRGIEVPEIGEELAETVDMDEDIDDEELPGGEETDLEKEVTDADD